MDVRISKTMENRLKQTPVRAPLQHGSYLLLGQLHPDSKGVRQALDCRFPFAESARQEAYRLAAAWTAKYLPIDPTDCNDQPVPPLVMSGHQPELFHPGVWFKNFVLTNIAGQSGHTAVNLIIDNDQQKSNWISFPVREEGRTTVRRQNFAYGGIGQPFEERTLTDQALFTNLPERLKNCVAGFAPTQLLEQFWKNAKQLSFDNIGYRFSAARHQIEWELGLRNLELPLSHLCETTAFASFVFEIVNHSQRFHRIYNQVLKEYRAINGINSVDRPVADLETIDHWCELPFWIWSPAVPYRQKLYARSESDGVEICNEDFLADQRSGLRKFVPNSESLLELGHWKLRTRALTTTMYCRGILSDSFLHGIGGSIYDQLTDEMFRRFFEVQLPPFVTTTATFRLPASDAVVDSRDLQQAKLRLRQLQWKPERFVQSDNQLAPRVAEKESLIAQQPVGNEKRFWQSKMQEVNAALRQGLSAEIESQTQIVSDMERRLKSQAVEQSREWSFLLFDNQLPLQLQELAHRAVGEAKQSTG